MIFLLNSEKEMYVVKEIYYNKYIIIGKYNILINIYQLYLVPLLFCINRNFSWN